MIRKLVSRLLHNHLNCTRAQPPPNGVVPMYACGLPGSSLVVLVHPGGQTDINR